MNSGNWFRFLQKKKKKNREQKKQNRNQKKWKITEVGSKVEALHPPKWSLNYRNQDRGQKK